MGIVPSILVSSSEVVLEQKPGRTSPLKNLTKNQTVVAKVLRVLSERRALLMIGGRKVSAKTYLPLQEGQKVLLKAVRADNRQVLKFEGLLAESAGPDQRQSIGSFGKARPYIILSQLLEDLNASKAGGLSAEHLGRLAALKDLIGVLSLRSDIPPTGDFLKRLIDGNGLLWESKLASLVSKGNLPSDPAAVEKLVSGDLKALVLQLLSHAKEAGAPEAFTGRLKEVLEGLEQHQLLNRQLLDNGGRYLLPIPMAEQPPLKFGQLLLGLGGRQKEEPPENRMVTVSFLLSLSHLGDLRADFSVLKKGLAGVFGVADETVRSLVTSHLPELRQKLQDHGFTVYDIACRLMAPQQLSEMSLVAQAVSSPSDGFFNLVV